MNFGFDALNGGHVSEWMALRMEGVRRFPMGFFWTEEEAAELTEELAK